MDRLYWFGWQCLLPGAAKRLWTLADRFGSLRAAWLAPAEELVTRGGFNPKTVCELAQRRAAFDPQAAWDGLGRQGIDYIFFDDPAYPGALRQIFDPPPGLFVRGKLPAATHPALAVVGSRRPTPYGLAVAERLAKEAAATGVVVVSGLARGIDSAAHRGALAAGGQTIAVLGCGLDVVYPRENRRLMEEIAASGAVLSEFPPGSPPEAWHFPVRNRIISGLSRATLVVEAAEKSGALITADMALEQGRDVLAVPGGIASPLSRGPNRLIKQGARLVEGVADILEELGVTALFNLPSGVENNPPRLTGDESAVYRRLSYEPATVDKLVEESALSAQQVLAALMFLEVKRLVRQLPGGCYVLRESGPGF